MSVNNNLPVIGIDEVGRGSLAGPLAVGAFTCSRRILRRLFHDIKESKQLSSEQREDWYKKILLELRKGTIRFAVSFVAPKTIDRIGLSKSLMLAVSSSLCKLDVDQKTEILLDGSLYAPRKFLNQKTIIKGDEKEPLIALASIVAKVKRDRRMVGLAKKYPQYRFEIHKGYGTRLHLEMIKKYGISGVHRRSFLKSKS